jgi:hypothetical protein
VEHQAAFDAHRLPRLAPGQALRLLPVPDYRKLTLADLNNQATRKLPGCGTEVGGSLSLDDSDDGCPGIGLNAVRYS